MTPTRPLMNYYGGKFNLASWIISQMPPHDIYIEAFGGALSVFMQKPKARLEVVNDLDLQIASLYHHLREAAQHLAVLCELTPYSRQEYYSAKSRGIGSLEDSRRTLVASYMGVGNCLSDSTNGFRNSKSSHCSPSQSWANYVDEFERFHARIRDAIIECLDYQDLFAKYDTPGALWYLDPPYVWDTRTLKTEKRRGYACEMTDKDHERLVEKALELRGMVLLSGYDHPIYDSLGWAKVQTEANTQRNGTRIETLWLNPACVAAQAQQSLFRGGPC